MFEFKDFIDSLEDNLASYDGEHDDFINYCPKLFNLLCNIFSDNDISHEIRYKMSLAIAYFVVPEDVVPENVFGPIGYVDDIYMSVLMINEVIGLRGIEFIKKHWDYYEDIQLVLNECLEQSEKLLNDEEKKETLKFVGL
ncbi:MAG: DUF1232 domain-containing protein [Methanobrevibacter sp.]|jgi:uncharacterized membrane protein YkvA (DUF1232 family)|nr:DUF1232 domain-containing protein [Methanobrevibacter sp.]